MRQSSNPLDGAQAFTIKVAKGEDGFTATCPSQPSVAAVTAPTQSSAITRMRQALQEAAANGKLKS